MRICAETWADPKPCSKGIMPKVGLWNLTEMIEHHAIILSHSRYVGGRFPQSRTFQLTVTSFFTRFLPSQMRTTRYSMLLIKTVCGCAPLVITMAPYHQYCMWGRWMPSCLVSYARRKVEGTIPCIQVGGMTKPKWGTCTLFLPLTVHSGSPPSEGCFLLDPGSGSGP